MYVIIQGKISLIELSSEKGNENILGDKAQNFLELLKISEDPSKISFLQSRRKLRNTRILDSERNNNSIFLTNFYKRLQEKILTGVGKRTDLTEGMCFGELDLINRRKRFCTAFASEDSDLFYIDKENFEMSLYKIMSKAESERIVFIFNMIPIFSNFPKRKFDEFYKQAVEFVIYKENEIIYEEGDKSEFIYLIYQGECCLKRDISKPYLFIFDEEAHKEELNKTKTILDNKISNDNNILKNISNNTRNKSEGGQINRNHLDNLLQNPIENENQSQDQCVFNNTLNFSKASVINTNSHYNIFDYPVDRIRSTIRINNKIDFSAKFENKINLNEAENKSKITRKYFENKNRNMETILIINPGDSSGLECSAGLKKLNHTLVCSQPFTVVAKINLNKISDYKKTIFDYFLPIYKEKEKIIEKFVKSHRNVKFKKGLKCRNNLKEFTSNMSINYDVNKQLQKDFDSEFEEKVNSMIEEVQKKKSEGQTSKNNSKCFAIDKIKIEANLFRKTLEKKNSHKLHKSLNSHNFSHKSDLFNNVNNNINSIPISNNISKLEVSDLTDNRILRRNTKLSQSNISREKTILSRHSNSNYSKIWEKEKVVNFSKSPIKTNFKIFDNSISLFSNDKNLNCPRDVLNSYKLSKNALFNIHNKEGIKSLKHHKIQKEKSVSVKSRKKHLSYNTGNFDMPLISFDMENYQTNNERILKLQKEIHKSK